MLQTLDNSPASRPLTLDSFFLQIYHITTDIIYFINSCLSFVYEKRMNKVILMDDVINV